MAGSSQTLPRDTGRMCQALRALDPGLRRVILVGSSVYGPEMARDIDLVVVSRRPLAPSAYAAAVEGFAPDGRPVDVIPLREGAPLGNLRLAVASGVCLLDDGSGPEASGVATLADFAEARSWLTTASTMIDVAMAQQGEQATRFAQEAFQALFHGARTAAMALLGMTEHRWGEARRELPAPLRGQFSMIIDNCHIRYGYEARFPPKPEAVRALFTQWKGRVETFIAGAEAEAIRRQPPNV